MKTTMTNITSKNKNRHDNVYSLDDRRRAKVSVNDPAKTQDEDTAGNERLNILWVKVGGLWPANTGGRLRSFHILSQLSKKHKVTILTTHLPGEDPDALKQQLPSCHQVISLPYASPKRDSTRFLLSLLKSWFSPLPVDLYKNQVGDLQRAVLKKLNVETYNFCIADFLFAVPNVPLNASIPTIFFAHNVEYMIWKRLCSNESNPFKRVLLELEWRKMRNFELSVCKKAEMTIAVSQEDCDQLSVSAPGCAISAIPTGVDIEYFRPTDVLFKGKPFELVFTGSMDWHPNEDAMLYFIDAILPLVRNSIPQVTLTIVGRNPGRKIYDAASKADVHVTGTVDDIRPYVDQAALYIVPLRIGGGTRLKIFEALAMGKAVVSTTIGAEGLPLEEGKHIVRADDARSFADKVVMLLKDRKQRRALGMAGQQLMEEKYSWSTVANEFEARCRDILV